MVVVVGFKPPVAPCCHSDYCTYSHGDCLAYLASE